MKQNSCYVLKYIDNIPYLLPYGQMIADQMRGMKINATGVFLWNLLNHDLSMDELLSHCADYYEVSPEELPEFEKDIRHFITLLISYGMIEASFSETIPTTYTSVFLSIGGYYLQLQGPAEAIPTEWNDFVVPSCEQAHQKIIIHIGLPTIRKNGQLLIRNSDLVVIDAKEQFILLFPASQYIQEIHLHKDGTIVNCYCLPPYSEQFHYDLFHALRLVYLYFVQQKGMLALHSASILYRNKAWLFSGHSGMGKSTHTNLWKELYQTTLLNGDLNLLAFENDQPVVYGIPWCGTSGICCTETYALGGIILLNQASCDTIEELSNDRKQLLISQRLISPTWTLDIFQQNLEQVKALSKQIMVCKLHCTKKPSAAEVMKAYIDNYLAQD